MSPSAAGDPHAVQAESDRAEATLVSSFESCFKYSVFSTLWLGVSSNLKVTFKAK